ncbi:MAG: hypothetical protein JW952_04515 [Candidatus Eisenbacteria bacterium]|nr:hypothetical protein [Candidatus Eisenbacteria bacterium]
MGNGVNGKRKLRKLIETWVVFGEFLKTGLGREGVQSAQEEHFLALKAKIAHLLPVLTVIERGRSIDPEALAAVRDITEMLNSFTTLATPEPFTREETEEIIAQWHRIFIFLNRLEGALKDRRYGFLIRGERPGGEEPAVPRRSAAGGFVRFLIGLVTVVAVGVLVAGLLGITTDQAKETGRKGLGLILGEGTTGPAAARSTESDSVVVGLATKTTSEASGVEQGTAGTEPGKRFIRTKPVEQPSSIPTALRPLVRQYGRHLTMIVFAIFLAAIVFLFFVRVR